MFKKIRPPMSHSVVLTNLKLFQPLSKCCCFDVQVCSLTGTIVLLEKSWKLFERLKVFENIKLHSKDFD
jgi:hypothetical protein